MDKSKRNLIVLSFSLLCMVGITYLGRYVNSITALWDKIAALVCINLLNGLTAFAAMKLTGMKIQVDFRNKRQYLIGAAIALSLWIVLILLPLLFDISLAGRKTPFSLFQITYEFLFYFLIIGPVEEFIFRVYLQDTLVSFFEHHRWAGVVLTSFLFGCWHLINGSVFQALFTFGIGLVFGFAKYLINDFGYGGAAFSHGLYSFLLTLTRMFLI